MYDSMEYVTDASTAVCRCVNELLYKQIFSVTFLGLSNGLKDAQ